MSAEDLRPVTTMDTTNTTPRRSSDRYVVYATVSALIIEGVAGTVALLRAFGPELLRTMGGRLTAGEFPWISPWELLQVVVAISLIFWALLLARGTRRGLFGAAITQGIAVGLSGYHVLYTLPDTWGLIALVMVTTILLSTRAVREWCLGPSDDAFERLIADHRPHPQH
jgi:hypothetical protein